MVKVHFMLKKDMPQPKLLLLSLAKRIEDTSIMFKFSAITALVIALYFQDLVMVFTDAISNEQTYQILAIPPLFAYLIYRRRKILSAEAGQNEPNAGVVAKHFSLLAGILISAIAVILYWNAASTFNPLDYQVLTLPLFIAGLVLIFFNTQTLIQLIFPIAFLLFLLPPPEQILYNVGAVLSVWTSQAPNAIIHFFGVHSAITSSYGSPTIVLTMANGQTMNFMVDVACSGIYSLIGFLIFSVFVAYISRGKIWHKFALLFMGVPLIIGLNVFRITIILVIGYYLGDQLALQVFHAVGATVLMFIGTLVLLVISDRLFKNPKAPQICQHKVGPQGLAGQFCPNCGKLLKTFKSKLKMSDVAKIASIAIIIGLLLSIQAPVFALTEGPAQVFVQTPNGAQGNTLLLPQVQNYTLQYSYRDTSFEQLSGSDADLAYLYVPDNPTNATVYVAVEVASSLLSLHQWEYCLAEYPLTLGLQPDIKQLDLRDITTQDNPPIVARYFAFQTISTNQTQVVLYWYQTATLNLNGVMQSKIVEISLIEYPQSISDVPKAEAQLVPFAKAIDAYWAPLKTWGAAEFLLSAHGLTMVEAIIGALVVLLLYYGISNRRDEISLLKIQRKLSDQDKQLIAAVRQAQKSRNASTVEVANHMQELTEKPSAELLPQKLLEVEKTGLIRRTIKNVDDEPVVQWKSRVADEGLVSSETDSMSTIFKFFRDFHL
jgi:exosortase